MSTIVSSFVQDRASAKQLPTADIISGVPKAWAWFNQAAVPTVADAFNVTSVGDGGLGKSVINTTTAFVTTPVGAALSNSHFRIIASSSATTFAINCQDNTTAYIDAFLHFIATGRPA